MDNTPAANPSRPVNWETGPQLREQIERLLEEREYDRSAQGLAHYWRQERTPAAAHFVNAGFERIAPEIPLVACKLALLRSFTVEPLVALLRAAAFSAGIRLEVWISDFNTYVQEILNPQSALYAFQPDCVILAAHSADLAPKLWSGFSALSPAEAEAAVKEVNARLRNLVDAFRGQSPAHLIVHNLVQPLVPSAGVLDARSAYGQRKAFEQINDDLRQMASQTTGVYLLDYDALVARHGRQNWADPRKWHTMRLPIGSKQMIHVVDEWMKLLHPITGKIAKVVVVDLDNTLWGGVIAEDGMAGIQLGSEYPGVAFQELQRVLLDVYQRGILLAVASKNNAADAMEAINSHPGMVLRAGHLAALRINWNSKARSLREIASELNLGIDSLVFIDDNPVERSLIRRELPEVTVLDLPKDPLEYAQVVRDCPALERLYISEEDRQRGKYYAVERRRAELEQTSASPEDFLRSLKQVVEIRPVSPMTLARVAQLTQKTNQFNLTTRRYSEQQVRQMSSSVDMQVFSMRVEDVYSDNGLVGVAILNYRESTCEIDTFLLSCRVIGRTVETALLAFLCRQAMERGAKVMEGWFLPTKKNAPARAFYAGNGFQAVEETELGTRFTLELPVPESNPHSTHVPAVPDWITLL